MDNIVDVDFDVKNIRMTDYDYCLPDERIAKYPLQRRDSSKLLVYDKGKISSRVFRDIDTLIPSDSLMVFNNTKVIRARTHFQKSTGAKIEIFLLEPHYPADYEQAFQAEGECEWQCIIGNLKKWKDGILTTKVIIDSQEMTVCAERREAVGTSWVVRFVWQKGIPFARLIEAMGTLPIPPYLNRDTEESDNTTYQTVYSKIKGSVAAPTAGLHFTPEVLQALDDKGVVREELTLHVGAGTFKPVKSATIGGHDMHTEAIAVRRCTIERLLTYIGRTVAVGTTSVRTLESLFYLGLRVLDNPETDENELCVNQWEPYERNADGSPETVRKALQALLDYYDHKGIDVLHAVTRIIIVPSYKYKIVNRLITNFHQPQSTLLLLVSAMIGDDWHKVYQYALDNDFRFLSYGDSSLLIP
ncbi:MAG: S-adenosylmethionine:tRNA ribosyltransferase-isomerase [Prevotella sp.]|nr:S-adenosylmethionine:tRNA ribosyltransferase-isomerase [Prevotella sp.]